ncbi:hypothetical protein BRD17_09795 [Halobacteriales archaeon SW_7_68_16]|nr:MAG: hypothetical protein BRD17_09795 [Halobacteriales archaeon SW_7_68_16]
MFAIRDDDCSGEWFYRFRYYHSEDGEKPRYDNAHDDVDLGCHHRHIRFGDDTEIEFHGIVPHVTRFPNEIAKLTDTEDTNHDRY